MTRETTPVKLMVPYWLDGLAEDANFLLGIGQGIYKQHRYRRKGPKVVASGPSGFATEMQLRFLLTPPIWMTPHVVSKVDTFDADDTTSGVKPSSSGLIG